ncbi:hypothetical protein GCM10009624_05390 [Gordonia sinesedis]
MLLRLAALLAYLLVRLVLWVCKQIGRPFHVGGLTIASVGAVAAIAGLATLHRTVFDESGAQPIVLMAVAYPVLIGLLALVIVRWRTFDPDKKRRQWEGREWVDD